ncbi:MAG TPA: hypothetical protein VD905_03945 [Flavobacteriales bacterium]|nr:hypothetical protein [Flavobacteriales bacterium]
MKKILVLYFLFSCFGNVLPAQSVSNGEITWGPVYETQKNANVKTIVSFGNGFYIVKTVNSRKKQGIYIEKYAGENVTREKQAFFNYPVFPNGKAQYEKIIYRNGALIWYVNSFDRVNRKHELFSVKIDADLTAASNPELVDGYSMTSSRSLPGFTIHEATGRRFTMIARKFPYDKFSNEKYYLMMFDSTMKELWKKEIELPYANNLLDITDKLIDRKGNVHLLATLAPEKQKGDLFNRSMAANKYLLVSFYPAENKLKEFEINLDGKYITAVTAGMNPANNIAVGGFYSNSNSFTLAGTFYLTVSPETKQVLTLNQKPFEKEFLMEFMSERAANRGEELTDFYFDHFILNADGSAMLVAEEYYKQTHTYFDPYNQLYYDNNTYNYNSIIVVKVNQAGEIAWTRKISKRQVSTTGYNEYFSYALAKGSNQLYIMFNDHSGNLKDRQVNAASVYGLTQNKYSAPVLVTLDSTGAGRKQRFYEADKERLTFLPSVSRRLNDDIYLIARQRKNKIQFGRLKVN